MFVITNVDSLSKDTLRFAEFLKRDIRIFNIFSDGNYIILFDLPSSLDNNLWEIFKFFNVKKSIGKGD